MKSALLLPRICRIIGAILLPLSIAMYAAAANDHSFAILSTTRPNHTGLGNMGNYNLTDEVATLGIIVSLFMIAFSKLKHEDEYIKSVRLQSLQIGVYANYAVFIIQTFTVYGLDYLMVLAFNILTILVLFILVFNFNLYIRPRFSKTATA